ncbi:MAG: DNA recombination protein RmuC [Bacteroidales bacterium]|nr:DNA recombination protein RmuC [Bacteroidales bacterium]
MTIFILLGLIWLSLLLAVYILIQKIKSNQNTDWKNIFDNLNSNIQRIEINQREEFRSNRQELINSIASLSDILSKNILQLGNKQNEQFDFFSKQVQELSRIFNEQFKLFQEQIQQKFIENKEDMNRQLKAFQDSLNQSIKDFNEYQAQKFSDLLRSHEQMRQDTENKLEKVRETVEKRLETIQTENNKKLEEMRATVDEKLQSTLEKRLSESFKLVSERLEQVHKGLGEMQNLASDVGDLKKVLSNVKQRGIIGEIQLGAILENILSPGQYEKNVRTKPNTSEVVEYAIVLPGKEDPHKPVYLPIDSKFPMEDYLRLLDAYNSSNPDEIKSCTTQLQNAIKKSAKDIHDKYINPPNTTEFGILFLPVEGLYAEVVRQPSLIEELSRTHKIIVAGPTTLAALLNSLQMGFRTLAIEKRSSEVWKILQAVKTEFNKFEDVLVKAKNNLDKASEDIEKLVGTRTRQIRSKLHAISELPEQEAKNILDDSNPISDSSV